MGTALLNRECIRDGCKRYERDSQRVGDKHNKISPGGLVSLTIPPSVAYGCLVGLQCGAGGVSMQHKSGNNSSSASVCQGGTVGGSSPLCRVRFVHSTAEPFCWSPRQFFASEPKPDFFVVAYPQSPSHIIGYVVRVGKHKTSYYLMSQSRLGRRRQRGRLGLLRHLLLYTSRSPSSGGKGGVLASRVRQHEHGPPTQAAGDGLLLRGAPPPSDAALSGK